MASKDYTMQEQWMKWDPVSGLASNYYLDSVSETIEEGLSIILFEVQDKHKKISITFPNGIDAYKVTNENFTTKFMDKPNKRDLYDWTFFKITNSAYLKWLSENSYGVSDSCNLQHWCIVTVGSVIDILDSDNPIITFLE